MENTNNKNINVDMVHTQVKMPKISFFKKLILKFNGRSDAKHDLFFKEENKLPSIYINNLVSKANKKLSENWITNTRRVKELHGKIEEPQIQYDRELKKDVRIRQEKEEKRNTIIKEGELNSEDVPKIIQKRRINARLRRLDAEYENKINIQDKKLEEIEATVLELWTKHPKRRALPLYNELYANAILCEQYIRDRLMAEIYLYMRAAQKKNPDLVDRFKNIVDIQNMANNELSNNYKDEFVQNHKTFCFDKKSRLKMQEFIDYMNLDNEILHKYEHRRLCIAV